MYLKKKNTSSGLLYIMSTNGTTLTIDSESNHYSTESNTIGNVFDDTVTFDQMLSTTYTKQEYKILVHAAFGTFADGSIKEYTKEYTFTSNLKDNNTNLVLYINGKKVEHNNGVFESSISYTAKDYELKAEAESNYALVGINLTPPTNVKTETKTIETPDQEIENVRIYVTAQDGTLAPYGEGDGGYYINSNKKE